MNFSDKWATNDKGEKFVFTVEMQRRLNEAGLPVTAEALAEFRKTHTPPSAPDPNRRDRNERSRRPARVEMTEVEVDPATGKFIGILKTYNSQKGFGFIGRGGGDNDIYFNKKKALDDPSYLTIGGKVLFTVSSYRGKEEAADVEEYEEWG